MALAIPELQDNRAFLEAISLQYKSYNLFEEMMEMELMQKRVEFIQTMKESMIDMDVEGNEIKYFSSKFLVQKYLKYSTEDIKLNNKLKQEEIEELHLAGGENSDPENMNNMNMMGESNNIDYDKLANMIVERMSSKYVITEDDKKEKHIEDKSEDKPVKKSKKKKKNEEE
jgi:hypothetical protein